MGVDFSEYKRPTFERRLARRMALRRAETLQDYLNSQRRMPTRFEPSHEDILIHVTSFFRDPEVFNRLQTRIFPELLKDKPAGAPFRIWVAGCSSGEEVYSLAIALLESLGDSHRQIQIFGWT